MPEHIHVLIRHDAFHDEATPIEVRIATPKAMWLEEQAATEVERLNSLHPKGDVRYFYQTTRIVAEGEGEPLTVIPHGQNHPYAEFEGTPMWHVVAHTLEALIENDDLKLTTAPEYVIGALCQRLAASAVVRRSRGGK